MDANAEWKYEKPRAAELGAHIKPNECKCILNWINID